MLFKLSAFQALFKVNTEVLRFFGSKAFLPFKA
jgi:hypothetical protein